MDFIFNIVNAIILKLGIITNHNEWLITAIIAGAAIACRNVPSLLWKYLTRALTINITLFDSDVYTRSDVIDKILSYALHNSYTFMQKQYSLNDNKDSLILGEGTHFINVMNMFVLIKLSYDSKDAGQIRELNLRIMAWNRNKLTLFLNEIVPSTKECVRVYNNSNPTPVRFINKSYATQKQLIDQSIYRQIDKAFDRFMNNHSFYESHGKTRKESFLLFGEPGTGKTSLFRHLCAKYGVDIFVTKPVDLSETLEAIDRIGHKNILILIEDIVIDDTSSQSYGAMNSISRDELLSALLNDMDGITPMNNVMLAITTNHIENIPPELYRGGRIDHLFEVKYLNNTIVKDIITFDDNDPRQIFLNDIDLTSMSVETINKLSRAESVDDIVDIIEMDKLYKRLLHVHSKIKI